MPGSSVMTFQVITDEFLKDQDELIKRSGQINKLIRTILERDQDEFKNG